MGSNEEAEFIEGMVDQADWLNPEDSVIPEGLPVPSHWRVLVMPVQPKAKSKGGILLPAQSQDAEAHLQVIGRLAAVGPQAYRSFNLSVGIADWARILIGKQVRWAPKVGDWVIYGRYTGQRVQYKGTRLVLMNDDEILGRASGPEGFKVYI